VAAKTSLPVEATYRGTGTLLTTTPDGSSVHIDKIPLLAKCKPRSDGPARPTNLGQELGPFPLKPNGSFTNGQKPTGLTNGQVSLSGRFSSDGSMVTGKIVAAKFDDSSKNFHCQAFKGSFSATHVKGTGGKPGQILATDDFSNKKSGFDVFSTQNTFSEYLRNHRFRVGLRGNGFAVALRKRPVASVVEVQSTVRWLGADMNDTFGLVCEATDAASFDTGLVRMDGQAILARYVNGQVFESSETVALPAGLLKNGKGNANEITLTCIPDANGQETHVALSVNGQVVVRARSSATSKGKTGVFVGGTAGGTDYDYDQYQVSVPKKLSTT
jgi:hypothetical protein